MPNLFRTIELEDDFYGVFIANPKNEKDRYLVTSTFERAHDAGHFTAEFNRIADEWVKS